MKPPNSPAGRLPLRRWARVMLLVLTGAGGLGAQDWQSLLAHPPFGENTTPATGDRGAWEFRGVVNEAEGDLVNLYNPATKTSQWIAVPGRAGEIEVLAYDAGAAELHVTQAGRLRTLSLKHARISLFGYATTVQLIDPTQAPADDPAIADFMRNLPPDARKVLEEVRRRRAIRAPFPSGEPVRRAEPVPEPERR